MNVQNVRFAVSAASKKDFLSDERPQVAFAGRSNVGKSSVINCLLRRKNLAYVGATPGKTAHINYFDVDEKIWLVDLPGYGYAQVSRSEKERWAKLMEDYFSLPERIRLGVLIVDSRHKPTRDDITMAGWFQNTGRPFLVVANKLDKLKAREIEPNLNQIRETLNLSEETLVIPFSAQKGTGREVLLRELEKLE